MSSPKKQALSDANGAPASASRNSGGAAENVNPNLRLEGGVAANISAKSPAEISNSSAPAAAGASSDSKAEKSADVNSNSGIQIPPAPLRYFSGNQTGIPVVIIPPSDVKFSQAATAEGGLSGAHKLLGASPGVAAIPQQNPIRISQEQNLSGNGPAAVGGGIPQQSVASAVSQPTFAPAAPQGPRPGDVSAAAGSIATDQCISQMSAESLAHAIGGKIHNLDLEMWIREDIIGAALLELCASSLLTELLAEFMQQTAANDVETFTCFSKNYRRVVYKFNLNGRFASIVYICKQRYPV